MTDTVVNKLLLVKKKHSFSIILSIYFNANDHFFFSAEMVDK